MDGKWSFVSHLAEAARRANQRANMLGRLMPNIGRPSSRVRRLYANTERAIVLYEAPILERSLIAKKNRAALVRTMRPTAVRFARAYCMVSYTTAKVLAGVPPVELVARKHARAYRQIREWREREVPVTAAIRVKLRLHNQRESIKE